MAVSRVNFSSNDNAGGTTSLVLTKPASIADGDILLASIASKNTQAITIPSGWAVVTLAGNDTLDVSGTGFRHVTWYKVITNAAGEAASYTFSWTTSSKAVGGIVAYRGVNTSSPFEDVVLYNGGAGTVAYPDYQAVSYRSNDMIVGFGAIDTATTFTPSGGTEYIDRQSAGGGAAGTKASLTALDLLMTQAYPGGTTLTAVSAAAANTIITGHGILLIATGASVPLPAGTFDGAGTLDIITRGAYTYSDTKVNTGQAMFNGSASNAAETGASAYEVIGTTSIVGFYSEYQDAGPRQQEGRAHIIAATAAWDGWTDTTNRLLYEGQTYGAMAMDSVRISNNRFAVMYGPGHGWSQTGNDASSWSIESTIRIIDVVSGAGSPVGVANWMARGDSRPPDLGSFIKLGPNSVLGWGSVDNVAPTANSYNLLVCTIAAGGTLTRGTVVDFAGTNAVFASHVDDTKAVAFYNKNSNGVYNARVVNVSGTTITLGATEYALPTNVTALGRPIAVSSTKGFYAYQTSGTNISFQPYTISGDTVTFGTASSVITEGSTIYDAKTFYLGGNIVLSWARSPGSGFDLKTKFYTYNSTTEVFTALAAETIHKNVAGFGDLHVTGGSSGRLFLNYVEDDYAKVLKFNAPPASSTKLAFIDGIPRQEVYGTKNSYIEGSVFPISSSKPSFIRGLESVSSSESCFIAGTPIIASITKSAYIYGYGTATQSTQSFIQGLASTSVSKSAYVAGGTGPIVSSKPAYIKVIDFSEGSKSAYIGGAEQSLFGRQMYLAGSPVVSTPVEFGALSFNGSLSQRVEFNDNKLYTGLETMTVNLWTRFPAGAVATYDAIVSKGYTSTDRTFGLFKSIVANKIHYGVNTVTGAWNAQNSTASYVLNKWHMLTMIYDGINCKFYLDGVYDSQFAKTGALNIDTNKFYLAYRPEQAHTAIMDIADLTLWNYVVDDATISALYHPPAIRSGKTALVVGSVAPSLTSNTHAYIQSQTSSTNFLTATTGQPCFISWGILASNKMVYLVGSPIITEAWDTQIALDNFKQETFDLVVRFMVQGERARRFQSADVEYPITRVGYTDLPNIFYWDIPGRIFGSQLAFLHSGWSLDTHTGDLSGTNPNISPRIMRAYIPTVMSSGDYQTAFVNGAFTGVTGSSRCFIQGAPTETVKAFISGTTINNVSSTKYILLNGAVFTIQSQKNSYIKAWDIATSSRLAMVLRPATMGDYHNAYIVGVNVQTKISGNLAYIPSSVIVVRSQPLYMKAHLFGFNQYLSCFLHAKPAISGTKNCYVASPFLFFNETVQRLHIMTQDIKTGSKSCHISADRNVIGTKNSFIYGYTLFESAKRAYITNIIITTPSSTKMAYVQSLDPKTASQACVLNAGVVDPKQNVYISSVGTIIDRMFCYVNGPEKIGSSTCYITA